MTKTSKGRRKIEIKKIEKISSRQVTFSKRRTGLFKKADELCTLTGAEIAIIVESVGGNRVFSFGHPNVDPVVDRFLNNDGGNAGAIHSPSANTCDFDRELSDAWLDLEAERKRMEIIEGAKMVEEYGVPGGENWWWDEAVEGKDVEELERYGAALDELIKNVTRRMEDLQGWGSFNGLSDVAAAGGYETGLVPNDMFDFKSLINFDNKLQF